MADFPRVPFPDSVTQPVRTAVSESDVASPYQQLARGLDKVGEKLSEVSVPLAERAADQAVRVDDSGNPIVDRSPFPLVGDAATAYARRTRMTYAAKMEPQIQNEMLKLRLEHPDPEAFKAAASEYSQGVVDNVNDPVLKQSIGTMAATNAAHNYRTSLTDEDKRSTAENLQTLQARIKDINERGALIARQRGTDTPEYEGIIKSRATFYKELAADPKIKFSPERAALEIKENRDNDIGQAVIGEAQRLYKSKDNLGEAKKFLQDTFWNSDRVQNMTPAKRDHFVAEGLHALANLDAKDREAINENRQAVTKYLSDSQANPRQWNPIAHDNMIERAQEIGDTKSVHELQSQRLFMPIWNDMTQMDGPQRAEALDQLHRGIRPGAPYDKFIVAEANRIGINPDILRRYAQIESGGNPYARTGSYMGLFQLSNEEFARNGGAGNIFDPEQNTKAAATSLRARADLFQQKYGREPSATELYLAHQQGDDGLRAHLANPAAPAWMNMLSTGEGRQKGAGWAKAAIWGNVPTDIKKQFPGGVESMSSQDFMNIWQRKVEGQLIAGQPVDLSASAATARLWESTIHQVRAQTAQSAQQSFVAIKKRIDSGAEVKQDEVDNFIHMAISSGGNETDKLLTQARTLFEAHDANASAEPGTSASVFDARVAAAIASGASDVHVEALEKAAELHRKAEEDLKNRPLYRGSIQGKIDPPNTLQTENPQALVSELQNRNTNINRMKQDNPQMGPTSVIDKEEAIDFGHRLTSGPGDQAAQALTALKTLPDESYVATMSQPGIKDAVVNMSRSNDPVKFRAGMTALSTMWKEHQPLFEAVYGSEAKTRMLAYQALQGSLDDATIMARLNEGDDPAKAQSRKDIRDAVDEETKKWDPTKVASLMGSSWQYTPGFISRAIGTTPAVSTSELVAGEMKHNYIDTYKALREFGVDKDTASAKAIEGLKSEWQPSQVNGGSLMKHAPEAHYPEINGSHDWMRDHLMDHIESVMGPEVSSEAPSSGRFRPGAGNPFAEATVATEGFSSPTVNWTFEGLISNDQTEREVKSPPAGPDGKARGPSYQIAVKDSRGQIQILPDRFFWDPAAPTAANIARQKGVFDARRSNIDTMKPLQGITGPM